MAVWNQDQFEESIRKELDPCVYAVDMLEGTTPATQTLTNANEWYVYDLDSVLNPKIPYPFNCWTNDLVDPNVSIYSGPDSYIKLWGSTVFVADKKATVTLCFATYNGDPQYKTDLQTPSNMLVWSRTDVAPTVVSDSFNMYNAAPIETGSKYSVFLKSTVASTKIDTYSINFFIDEWMPL